MTVTDGFGVALVAVIALVVGSGALLVGLKVVRASREAKRSELMAAARPMVLASIDEPDCRAALAGHDQEIVEAVAVRLLPNLRGADRDELTATLDELGVIAGARRRLRSRNAARRQQAADLIGYAADTGSLDAVIDRLVDRDVGVRAAAARAIGRIGDGRGVSPLFEALILGDVSVNTITMALLRLGEEDPGPIEVGLVSESARVRAVATDVVGLLDLVHLRHRVADLVADEPNVRFSAIRALGRLGSSDTAAPLIRSLERAVAQAVDTTQDPDAPITSPELRVPAALEHESIALIEALGRIGDRRAIPVLTECLATQWRIAHAASDALAPMGARRSPTSEREREREKDRADETDESTETVDASVEFDVAELEPT